MKEKDYITIGAITGFIYSMFSSQNIITTILIVIIGGLLGKAKWYKKENKEREFQELISKDEVELL